MANPSSSTGFLEHKVELKRSCQSTRDMRNKENVSTIEEDSPDISTFSKLKEETMQKTIKKAGRCNLRKSLAWNQAFFTEEGVLDPLELSVLNGSSIKPKESVLSVINGQISPLVGFHKSGNTTPLNVKMHVRSGSKNLRDGNLLCKLDASIQEEQQEIMVSGARSSSKHITKTMPRLAAASSQKRVANTNVANPTSKIPKFMPTKSHASSLPATSKDAISTPRNFKFDQSATTVNTEQNLGVRFFPSNMRKQSACAQSSKSSAIDDCRPSGTTISCSSIKGSSSLPKKDYHAVEGAVGLAHAKPSALRMPSPSLGFFQQGKVPHSCSTQPQRNVQPCRPPIPLVKATGIRPPQELRLLPALTRQKSEKVPAAPKSYAGTAIYSKMENSLVSSSLPSSNGNVVHPSTRENVSKIQLDMTNIGASGRSDGQRSGRQALKRHHLLVDGDIGTQPQALSSENPESSERKEVQHVSSSTMQMDNKPLVHENRLAKESLKADVSEDVRHTCSPTRKNCSSETESTENSSQACLLWKLNVAEVDEGASVLDNQAKQPPSGYAGQVSHPVSGHSGLAAGNLHVLPDLEFDLSATVDFSALPKTKSPLRLSKEKMAGFGSSSELGSLDQETGVENDSEINHLSNISSEETKSSLTSSKEQMACSGFISNSEIDCSLSEKTGMPVEKANSVTNDLNDLTVRLSSSSEDSQPTPSMDDKVHHSGVLNDLINSKEEETLVLACSENEQKDKVKQDIGHLKHHLNAVPFTDEWLTAIEACGEEILQLKSGPVQNSPPDKTLPEPGPWSPVKRKAQDIGPFDCTKYSTNLSASDS